MSLPNQHKALFVCGTDTGVGKTHAAAAILVRYKSVTGLSYWKPVQTGFPPDDDSQLVRELTNYPQNRILPTGFTFREPLSPHRAAELEKREFSVADLAEKLAVHRAERPLLVEGAGGILVPLNRRETYLDFLIETKLPVVIVARSALGTINHSLLTYRTLRSAGIDVAGIFFCGRPNLDNMSTIEDFTGAQILGAFLHEVPGSVEGHIHAIDPNSILEPYLR